MNRTSSLRNFDTTQYLLGPVGAMRGNALRFLWEAIVRVNNASTVGESFEWIIGNTSNAGTKGYLLGRGPDSVNANGTRIASFLGSVTDGVNTILVSVQIPLTMILGKSLLLTCEFDASSGPTPTLKMYINGALVNYNSSPEFTAFAPSAGQATIGYGTNASPLTSCDFIAGAYADDSADSDPMDARMGRHFDEVMKRNSIPPIAAFGLSDGIPWNNNYDVFNNVGTSNGAYPPALTNLGTTAPDGDMVLTGGGTTLVVGTPPIEWASASISTLTPPPPAIG